MDLEKQKSEIQRRELDSSNRYEIKKSWYNFKKGIQFIAIA